MMAARKSPAQSTARRNPLAALDRAARLLLAVVLAAAALTVSQPAAAQAGGTCPSNIDTVNLIAHDLGASFCELCSIGTVQIEIENPYRNQDDADFSEIVIVEDLRASGLTYVPNSTSFTAGGQADPANVEPSIDAANGSRLTWTLDPSYVLEASAGGGGGNARTLTLEFDVEYYSDASSEDLVVNDRNIEASVSFTPSCEPANRYTSASGLDELPLLEPAPAVIKTGRNLDAGQGRSQYTDTVYGHENDDVIWRIQVQNNGTAPLQDFTFDDVMTPGNYVIDYVCDSQADAESAGSGGAAGGCRSYPGVTTLDDVAVADLFGGGANPYIVAPPGGSNAYYIVGRVTDSCTNQTNTVNDIQWGCQVQTPPGGITTTSTGLTPASDSAGLNTLSNANLQVDMFLEGANRSQPMGTKGTVSVRLRNRTGGTIYGDTGGIILDNIVLPPEYVVDPTFDPVIALTPAYGSVYPGMVDTVTWTNPQPGTLPLTSTDPADPLANTSPEFSLTSSTPNPDTPNANMIRHGDDVIIRFRVVLIDPTYYDRDAYIDIRNERPGSDPANTDPPESFPVNGSVDVTFREFCTGNEYTASDTVNDMAEPEDIDLDVSNGNLEFILTDTDPTRIVAQLINRGGHEARDYFAYVTFGDAMQVSGSPGACSEVANPPPIREWQIPVPIPASATVYRCNVAVINPGQRRSFNFDVIKNPDASAEDDLTFRIDVTGEITLSDGTPLWFPTPQPRVDGIPRDVNDYSVDTLRARVVGYNLVKSQVGTCTENNPPPGSPDDEVQIGEECTFNIQSGGWFGFETPGYDYIQFENAEVVDNLPDGQGYISSTDPLSAGYSTGQITGVSLNPPPAPLDEGAFDWTHNQGNRITQLDEWFRADATTRILNDPIDTRASPNLHAQRSRNVLTSNFDAIFLNPLTDEEELYTLGTGTTGYPVESRRRVDLTVTEPLITVTKEVCNETDFGIGPSCSQFGPLVDDGDGFDTYIFRVTVTNEAAADGVTRAPAYDVTVFSDMDSADYLYVVPLASDGLDNDGDGEIDEAGGEGSIVPDNFTNVFSPNPARIITSFDHSDALLRIDAGESLTFYYRVDPDNRVAPDQLLVETAYATYDSLEGESGNQSDPAGANGEAGGGRQYTSESAEATIQIIPVELLPKTILRTSNTPLSVPPAPQPVSIGEEIEFEFRTLIPVTRLRRFAIVDRLPEGMRCADAPVVDLDAPPYDEAGFVPGGVVEPRCDDRNVIWSFADQTLTTTNRDDRRFDFGVQFVGQVVNLLQNQDGLVIGNGGAYTDVFLRYEDEAGNLIRIDFDAAEVIVAEPLLELTKEFPADTTDATDILTVTVTATNNGTAPAYNPRFLDDLSGVDFSYIGNVAGANPPTNVDTTTYGTDQPLFTWDPGYEIPVGESISFTFDVQVGDTVQPLQVLENTIQADWQSLPGRDTALNSTGQIGVDGEVDGMRIGALPNAGNTLNDYEAEASDSVSVPPLAITKDHLDTALPPEIGAHKPFEVRIDLPEGESNAVSLADDLATGGVSYFLSDNADFDVTYEFAGIATINGQPPDASAFNAVPADGASGVATWDIGDVVTETEDDSAVNDITPYIRATYSARINNDLDTDVGDTLQNSATAYYTNGDDGAQASVNDVTDAITATEPALSAATTITNVTGGKNPGDPIEFGDIVQYVVTIPNFGNALAHDTNIVDTLPPELAFYSAYSPTAQINGLDVPGFVPTPAGAPGGPLVWGRANGDNSLDVGPGETLELTYQAEVVAPADPLVALSNAVWVDWTSLAEDSTYERTGAGCPTTTAPNDYCFGPASADGTPAPTEPPSALIKATTQNTAAIGETFTYRITVPTTPYPVPLYDVRILDDLNAAAADLTFVDVTKVTGTGPWTPVNTGDAKNLVIEDTVAGIDIAPGEQVVLDITVRLDDTPTNVAGLTFTNYADYTYNRLDNAPATILPGTPGTSGEMTVVEPELTLEKTGPPQMQLGLPATFTLNVHNIGDSPAHSVTLYDQLPNQADGGTCDVAPANVTAQIFEADGTTAVSGLLAAGTDFEVAFVGDPDCTLSVRTLSQTAAIGADQRLIVTYETSLDTDSQQGANLVNVAGATEWFSIDVSDAAALNYARTYTRVITDGTVGTLDHEDAHEVLVFTPVLIFEKTAANVTSGEDPATVATPGDTIRYYLRVENTVDTPLDDFSITDELDRLNAMPMFEPGTLTVVTVPAGADASNTDPAGGAAGTGLLDIRGLDLGGTGDSLLIEFEVQLAGVLPNGSYVYNQSEAGLFGFPIAISDDPNVNGPADPTVAGDEDPTQILIESAPAFDIDKVSAYIEGDPNVLLAGETLRYTITVENIGTDNATGVEIVDQIPENTTYVADSTTLNGTPLADNAAGNSALVDGIRIYAPQDETPGVMNAGVSDNTATIVFDVVVGPEVPDGTVISNQAFLSAVDYGIADQPSDDPRTPVENDPTQDVVGNFPLLFAPKIAVLETDLGTPGIVDPGDTLRYRITVYNNGAVPATIARLADLVPDNVTYVPDSTTLNGEAVGQPDGGVFPLRDRIDISSSDVTPPLPGAAEGVLNPGEAAVVEFLMQVDPGVPTGTLIENQAIVYTDELANVLTDGDGDPGTGPEPTVVVVGDAQQLAITKDVGVVGGGAAIAGATLEYTVSVRNVGAVPAQYVMITDDLDADNPGYLTYVDGSAEMNGVTNGVTVVGNVITADYSTAYGPLAPDDNITLRFRAIIDPNLADGTAVSNTADVTWNDPPQTDSATVVIDVGGMPGAGILSGSVWHDANHTDTFQAAERPLEGWTVTLLADGQPIRSMPSAADGTFVMQSVQPNYANGVVYSLRFDAPGAGSRTARLGETDSDFTDGLQVIDQIVVQGGSNLRDLNMPVDPNGVVYDSVARSPVAGAALTMVDARLGSQLPSSCFDDPRQQGQVTTANGYYKFDLNFSSPACTEGNLYAISVAVPDNSYLPGVSEIIPPVSTLDTAPFDVPLCLGSGEDADPSTPDYCEAQPSEFQPPTSVTARSEGTNYHELLRFDASQSPGSAQLFNNHIPLDPRLDGAVAVTKTTPMLNVTRGQLVPYQITVRNSFGVDLTDVNIVDRFPPGFRYVEGSARVDDVPTEPAVVGRELVWSDIALAVDGTQTIKLLLAVGAGVTEGEFVNRAQALNAFTGGAMSEEATATVRLVPDPTFDCTDVTGKVFDDINRNGYQDEGETGIAGVRLVTARGLAATTDVHGRYHITCAIVPNEARGSNFVLKLDDRTLPSGFRASTRPTVVQRATRGKALRINYGASIHRVVGLDVADAAFEPGTAELRSLWQPRIDLLLTELEKSPSVLRLAYVADVEEATLVDKRLKQLKSDIANAWQSSEPDYELVIESEIFWRRGGPPDR